MNIVYLGHSAFVFKINNKKIFIDTFLINSPQYYISEASDVFVTHGHSDHLGEAVDISKKTGARITAIFELANFCASQGASINGINLGAWIEYDWGKVIAVPAQHSSSLQNGIYTGCPCGYVFDINGQILYFAGDTALSYEMKVIGELYKPDIAFLPIGGTYTMDIEHATIAASYLEASAIIPMHYNTFPAINVDIKEFEQSIRNIGKVPIVLNIGQEIEL